MLKNGVRLRVPVRSLLLIGGLFLLPAWARADDFSFADAGTCTDPAFTGTFTSNSPAAATGTTPANPGGGLCLEFGNHSGHTLTSLTFTAALPDIDVRDTTNSVAHLCSGGPFFLTCDYVLDRPDNLITVEFFSGTNADGRVYGGIQPVTDGNNFEINLNNPCSLTAVTVGCTGQPMDNHSAGDWLVNSQGETITATPEPKSGALLLTVLLAMVARFRMAKRAHVEMKTSRTS